jgi:hypothetical protein
LRRSKAAPFRSSFAMVWRVSSRRTCDLVTSQDALLEDSE